MTRPATWNARKLREQAVPLKGKPLRDTVNYIKSRLGDPEKDNGMMAAFRTAIA